MLIFGACEDVLPSIKSESVKIIITSPPYADRRKNSYGGIKPEEYVRWFIPKVKEFYRVLSLDGSFFLNIKPHTEEGERSLYVFELILAIKKEIGFKFVDEFCWTKNSFPGKLFGRFKNAFEPIYHFTKLKPSLITFNPLACGTPIKEESVKRAYRKQCGAPANKSGMTGMNTTNIRHLKLARPSNVIHVNNTSNQFGLKQFHPATYPIKLCNFFIKSFSNEGDTILDPFSGSGTTCLAAKNLGRKFIGIEQKEEYHLLAQQRLGT